ncbi:MAG TPA: Gfo/Idh/MocA family oxidoreductase [Firmicutes bacterium]|nr:Gfo/Idh/MocA family oxidoreductase [Bacillota bacterium]
MEEVRVGVIGAGVMGQLHARAAAESNRERLVAVVDLDEARAREVAGRYGAEAYSDYMRLLDRGDVDVVCVATPDSMHSEPVKACLAAGKHVLVEKPLATTLEDSRAILDAERASGKILMVNYTHRWAAPYAKAREMIEQGALGKPIMIYARKNDTIDIPLKSIKWSSETSPAKFLSSHDLDLALWYFESRITEVYARGVKRLLKARGLDVYDAIQALVKFENGAIGTFESAWIYPNTFPNPTDSYIQLVGEKGVITLDRRQEIVEAATEDAYTYPKVTIVSIIDGKLRGAFKDAHEHFIDCVLTGKKPLTSGELGHHVAEVTVAIHKSIELGRSISLPLEV